MTPDRISFSLTKTLLEFLSLGTIRDEPPGATYPALDHLKHRHRELQGTHQSALQKGNLTCLLETVSLGASWELREPSGAKSLGLENHYKWRLFTPSVCLSTKCRLGSSLQEVGNLFNCSVPALASPAAPFNLTEHVDR